MWHELLKRARRAPWRRGFMARAAARDRGMTLLEIMIVLAIIALITGSVGLAVFGALRRGRIKTAKIAVKEIAGAAQQFMMDNNNKCPAGIDDLVAQRFLPKKPYKDPWNSDLILRCPAEADGDGVDVLSPGPDKAEGTADDIKSAE